VLPISERHSARARATFDRPSNPARPSASRPSPGSSTGACGRDGPSSGRDPRGLGLRTLGQHTAAKHWTLQRDPLGCEGNGTPNRPQNRQIGPETEPPFSAIFAPGV
jgi:hypothetical protein